MFLNLTHLIFESFKFIMYTKIFKNSNYLTDVIILKTQTFKNSIYKLCNRLFDIDRVIFINFFFVFIHFAQFFTTSVMSFQQFIIGGVFGFSAVILPQLELPNALVKVDGDQASWIGMYV